MYEPNVFPIEIAKMLAGNPVDQVKIPCSFHRFRDMSVSSARYVARKLRSHSDGKVIVDADPREKILTGNCSTGHWCTCDHDPWRSGA